MMNTLRSELLRFASRRLFHVLLVGAVLMLVGIGGVAVFLTTRGDDSFSYATAAPLAVSTASNMLFTLSVVVGASFVGAEWSSGSLATLLASEPRRGRVFGAKLASCALATSVVTLMFCVLVLLVLVPSAIAHGTFDGVTGSWWRSLGWLWVRGGLVAAIGAALGVGLAWVMRASAGPVAVWLLFQFVVSQLITVWRPGLFRWLPQGNVSQFLGVVSQAQVDVTPLLPSTSVTRAGLVLGAYAAGVLLLGYASFQRRDIT